MAKVKIKVSRQGLTRCPSCKAHIQVATPLKDTICPFCQTNLAEALASRAPQQGPLSRLMGSGRSAVIAASLLGVPAIGACDSDGGTSGSDAATPVADAADDVAPVEVYGMPADIDAGPVPDQGAPAPEYGMPADMEDIVESETTEEPPPVDVYGMPPDTPDE